MEIPTTKQVREIVYQAAKALNIALDRRYDRSANGEIFTYTDRTSQYYETERLVVFRTQVIADATRLTHEVMRRMLQQGLEPVFQHSEFGYIRVYAAIA